jgi:Tfp pilus assembly protein FimV
VQFVPPTALAFEHTAVLASADLIAADDQDITDPGREDPAPANEDGTPTPAKDPRVHQPIVKTSRRTSFGINFAEAAEPIIEQSLIQEIEASEDFIEDPSDPEADTRAHYQEGRWKLIVLLSGIFLFATGLGFLGVWLALR